MIFTAAGAACVACDFSLGMLAAGVGRLGGQGARANPGAGPVVFVAGDALRLPFAEQSFITRIDRPMLFRAALAGAYDNWEEWY